MNREKLVFPGERVDDLQLNGLSIIQNPSGFCFGVDAVLLSDFAKAKHGAHIVDLGTGNGILPLLLSAKTKASSITASEIQEEVAEMARRSVAYNGTLEEVIGTAAQLLKPGGGFFMVHRPSRLVDIIELMRRYKLEPKLLRFVHPKRGQAPNILLIKGVRGGGAEMRVEAPLYVYSDEGGYDPEILEIYSRAGVDPTPRDAGRTQEGQR